MYLDGLDEMDQQILTLLIENARLSYSEIGDRVGLSRVSVKSRVQALEEKGIIEAYTTIVNPQKISGSVSCFFEIETEPAELQNVIERLYHCQVVTQIYRVTGDSRLHVHAVASSQQEMEWFIQEILDPTPGLRRASCQVILSRVKDVKGLRL